MPKNLFEDNCYNNKSGKERGKYSLDPFENTNRSYQIEKKLNNKEIAAVFEFCSKGYNEELECIKTYAGKEKFKIVVVSPFLDTFHTIPFDNDNIYFFPAKSLPRFKNLKKIMPDLAEEGINNDIIHERQHSLEPSSGSAYKNFYFNFGGKKKKSQVNDIEYQTNLQRLNQQISQEKVNVEKGKWNINNLLFSLSRHYIFMSVMYCGARILEDEKEERRAIEWLNGRYPFVRKKCDKEFINNLDENIVSRIVDMFFKKSGDVKSTKNEEIKRKAVSWFIDSYAFIRKERDKEFTDVLDILDKKLFLQTEEIFLDEFKKNRKEVLDGYRGYIKKNAADNFYNEEDKECEDLRINVINFLNKMADEEKQSGGQQV